MRGRYGHWLAVTTLWLFAGGSFGTPLAAGQHDPHDEEMKVPDTVGGIWHEIDEQVDLLNATISKSELAKVHTIAFAIRDLAKGLPDKSKDLPAAKLKLLNGYVERVAEHARNLDTYGDAGNSDKTEAEFGRLWKRLDYMRKLYPESVLRPETHPDGGCTTNL